LITITICYLIGIITGVDLKALLHAGMYIDRELGNRKSQSKVATAMMK
jgi:hypothetical protein